MAETHPIRTFVVRAGRMTDAQKRALELHGPNFIIPYSKQKTDFECFFDEKKPLVAEIGFGMGQATWQIAVQRTEFNYLGIEVHTPGVGRLVMEIANHEIKNLKIIQHDAVEVFENMVPDASLAGIHLFYPDPWPKKRHHKRRIVRPELVSLFASKLAPGGYFYFVTDVEEYAISSLSVLSENPQLRNPFGGFAPRQEWRPETKFEKRAKIAGAEQAAWELYFIRSGS
ncbi:MAG: tRNA (guanosine(46)-N7)-methyltransferase TrmB [Spirochaetia bacterium]|nr:tRNA (guanosine(46)-N7)-methyltransferase TrmB [Spirochaetia bacterium]